VGVTIRARAFGFCRCAVVPLAAASVAVVVGRIAPLLNPLLVALAMGALVANSRLVFSPFVRDHASVSRNLLRLGIVFLGLRLPLNEIGDIGWYGVLVVLATVAITYGATAALGSRLGLGRELVTLIAAGFSVCGAAAIAAVQDTVRAREREVALAVGLVTIFGGAMIGVLPWAVTWLGLSESQGAVWVGASVHEVAQVVAAGSMIGVGAVALATTVKLARVALLGPLYLVIARTSRNIGEGRQAVPVLPWFIVGFMVMIAIRSVGVLPSASLTAAHQLTMILLAGGMFGLGLGLRWRDLWPLPLRAVALATVSTTVACSVSLALIGLGPIS